MYYFFLISSPGNRRYCQLFAIDEGVDLDKWIEESIEAGSDGDEVITYTKITNMNIYGSCNRSLLDDIEALVALDEFHQEQTPIRELLARIFECGYAEGRYEEIS